MGPQANRFAMIGIFGLLEAVARFELVTGETSASISEMAQAISLIEADVSPVHDQSCEDELPS